MMSVPKSVQALVDAAEAIHAATYTNPEGENSAGEAPQIPNQDEQTDPALAAPPKPDEEPTPSEDHSNQNEAPRPDQDALYWQHRYNVINGKYVEEVSKLTQQIRELKQQLSDTSNQSDDSAAGKLADQISSEMTEDELEMLGPELVAAMRKIAAGTAGKANPEQNQPQNDEVLQRLDAFERSQQEDREARFWSEINARVPDWQSLQGTQAGQQWLEQLDPASGKTRDELLKDAAAQQDAYRVIAIFNQLKNETVPQQQPESAGRKIPEHKVLPEHSRSTGSHQQEAHIWTGDEISQFYRDNARGRYSAEQAKAIEEDIFKAQVEGRIA